MKRPAAAPASIHGMLRKRFGRRVAFQKALAELLAADIAAIAFDPKAKAKAKGKAKAKAKAQAQAQAQAQAKAKRR